MQINGNKFCENVPNEIKFFEKFLINSENFEFIK